MDPELIDFDLLEDVSIAFSSDALFDQYDEPAYAEQTDEYENLYPSMG